MDLAEITLQAITLPFLSLLNSDNPMLKALIIKNLKSHDQLKLDNFAKDVLRMLPNGKSLFLGGNGRILQKRTE